MDDHLSAEHQIGTPRKCNICSRLLKSKKGVKQHIRDFHKKEFNYKCAEEDCTYGSGSKQAFDTYMARHHGKKPSKTFKCKKCKKKSSKEQTC